MLSKTVFKSACVSKECCNTAEFGNTYVHIVTTDELCFRNKPCNLQFFVNFRMQNEYVNVAVT